MSFTSPEIIQAQLVEAEAAYHSLMTGTMPRVVVDQNGQRVEYNAANKAGLYNYIAELRGKLPCMSAPCGYNNGPAQFLF